LIFFGVLIYWGFILRTIGADTPPRAAWIIHQRCRGVRGGTTHASSVQCMKSAMI